MERKKIIDFFHGFVDFEYVQPPIKRIGAISANGFVKEIKYERNGYLAHAVLKSSVKPNSDNLVYEYIVGQFINQVSRSFPCFVETYGLYYYKNANAWKHMRDTSTIRTNVLRDSLQLQDPKDVFNYSKMCAKSKFACILIQHLNHVKSFGDIFKHRSYNDPLIIHFLLYEALFVFYQIYLPLTILRNSFTHYDLHHDNVLLYEPVHGKYIEYHYHYKEGSKLQFKSKYIVKIIDYGRSFFQFISTRTDLNPLDIYKGLCSEKNCSPCGENFGFTWLEEDRSKDNQSYFINSLYSNQSHDMRLLYNFHTNFISQHNYSKQDMNPEEMIIYDDMKQMLSKIVYGVHLKDKGKNYGTIEAKHSGLPDKIYYVGDIEKALREIIMTNPYVKIMNDHIYSDPNNKIGDMYIYTDGSPMRFEPKK